MSFHSRDIRWFSQLVLEMYTAGNERELFHGLVRALDARFKPLATVVEEVAYSMSSFRFYDGVLKFELPNYYLAALEDSPMVVHWKKRQSAETLHLSMMTSRTVFHGTGFYDAICQSIGLEDQLTGSFQTAPGLALNLSVGRDALFSSNERLLMEHVRRHVAAGVTRLRRSAPTEASGAALELHLTVSHQSREMPREIQRLLAHYFPTERRHIAGGKLPDEIHRWVKLSVAALRACPPIHPLTYLRTEGPRGHLFIRFFASGRANAVTLRFSERAPRARRAVAAQSGIDRARM